MANILPICMIMLLVSTRYLADPVVKTVLTKGLNEQPPLTVGTEKTKKDVLTWHHGHHGHHGHYGGNYGGGYFPVPIYIVPVPAPSPVPVPTPAPYYNPVWIYRYRKQAAKQN